MNPARWSVCRWCTLVVVASVVVIGFASATACAAPADAGARPPNVVLIFVDDMGYADLHCYGSNVPTPNLDRMAKEGMRFTSFYVAQGVCSASRAALMTGCYSNRVSIRGALFPNNPIGLNPNEDTIAEILKRRGYATAIFGKWHLGDREPFLPVHQGFDEYFGLPYSNDMFRRPNSKPDYPELPLLDGTKTIELNPDQTKLTTLYTEHAVKFIEDNKGRPFFLYVPHSMPHVPLAVSEKFKGKSPRGLYGDVVMELDWSVGQILDALKRNGLDEQTLVAFTSDNGPWLVYGNHGGSAGPLREGKATAFEGGVREPFIARWPGHIPAGRECNEPAMTIDLLPTFAKLAGATLATDRIIDGKDIWPLLAGEPGAKSPHEALYFYWGTELHAVRSGKWKLHFPHPYWTVPTAGADGVSTKAKKAEIGLSLFDLEADVGESKNVAAEHPDVVKQLEAFGEQAREDLGDSLTNRIGKNVRPPGNLGK
jgi:arylsulfatase A-like enzyme